jgi:peroxiredoxin
MQAPDFKLFANTGGEISLSDYRGKAHVVIFFVREFI